MSFSKEKALSIFMIVFSVFLIVKSIALRYARSYRFQTEGLDAQGNDILALYERNQLEKMWEKTAVQDLITPEKIADLKELRQARIRLQEAESEIHQSEKRVLGVTGKRREFFQKVHTYFHHSVDILNAIINFLIAKEGEYSVKGNHVDFDTEDDAEKFRELVNRLSDLDREKQQLDAFIAHHNEKLKNKLSGRLRG